MTCLRCLKARRTLAEAARAIVKGDSRRPGAEVKVAGAETAGKIKDTVVKLPRPHERQNSAD